MSTPARYYSSIAQQVTLTGSITASTTTIQVSAATGFPGSTPFTIALDYGAANEELVDVTMVAGLNWTVTRAVDGTSATSHNAGAVVRHVSSARDFTESRAHEIDNTGVHGVTGGLVGTTDTQTLTNKTLTNPTINGATATGTWAGQPTYTADPIFQRASSSDTALEVKVSGDTQPRFRVLAGGDIQFGDGSTTPNAGIRRSASNTLATDDQFTMTRPLSTDFTLFTRLDADSGTRWAATAGGALRWGDGAGLVDIILDRTAADTLTLGTTAAPDNLIVKGTLSVEGVGREIIVYKTADTARTSTTTRTDDPHLTVSLPANTKWIMDGYVKYSASTVADFSVGFTVPADIAKMSWSYLMPDTAATSEISTVRTIETDNNGGRAYGGVGSTTELAGGINGYFSSGPTGGTVALSWAQGTSDAVATTVYEGSWLRFVRVA